MICDELGASCVEAVPAVTATPGIPPLVVWLIAGAALVALGVLVTGLIRSADRPMPDPTTGTRPTHRCQYGHGIDRCPGMATRVVLMTTGPTMESRLMCDEDAQRMAVRGLGIDLGAINRGRA